MKRGLFLLIFIFIILPNIYATISFNDITPKVYNLGDKINFIGYVSKETSFSGVFKVTLICNNSSIPLMTRTLSLSANEKYNFQEKFTVPNIITGNCNLKSVIEEDNKVTEEKTSDLFTITKELKGNFILASSKIQLGKDIEVVGDVFKLNGQKTNGVANIYFKRDNNILFIDTTNIKDGNFVFKIPANYTSTGNYVIDFSVKDSDGNEASFTDAIKFSITNLLSVDIKLSKTRVNPGSSFDIDGQVKDVYGNRVNSGTFKIKMGDNEFTGGLLSGDITYRINTAPRLKTGFHNILIEVLDNSGNKGGTSTNIEVASIPTRIEINFDKDSYKPEEKMNIKAFVYDQGDDLVSKDINLEIRDSNNENKFEQVIKTDAEFTFPVIAKPGEWIIKAKSGVLKNEKKFYISEVRKLGFDLQGQTLTITNIGNVKYNDVVNIKLDGIAESLTRTKDVKLEPGEGYNINLGNEVKTGIYKITVNDKVFNNIKINGDSALVYYNDYSSLIFIIVVIVILGILLYLKKKKFFRKKQEKIVDYASEVRKVLDNNQNLVKKEFHNFQIKPQREFRNYVEIKPRKENLDKFRNTSSYLKRRKQEGDFKDGMFNMFK